MLLPEARAGNVAGKRVLPQQRIRVSLTSLAQGTPDQFPAALSPPQDRSRGLLQAAGAQRSLAAQRAAGQQVTGAQGAPARGVVRNHLRANGSTWGRVEGGPCSNKLDTHACSSRARQDHFERS